MTRHRRLQKKLRCQVRCDRTIRNRAHRQLRRQAWLGIGDLLRNPMRPWIMDEMIGMMVHRPQNLITLTKI